MRQVCRRNNSNKETLMYIPYTPCYRNPSVYDPIAKQHNKLLINILLLLLLLILPIYLGCALASQHTYIHIWVSWGCYWKLMMKPTGYVYSGSHAYPGPRPKMFCCWSIESAVRRTGVESYIMPIQKYNMRQEVSAPLRTPGGPQVELKVLVA